MFLEDNPGSVFKLNGVINAMDPSKTSKTASINVWTSMYTDIYNTKERNIT